MADEATEDVAARAASLAAPASPAPHDVAHHDLEAELYPVEVKSADETRQEDAYARHFRLVLSAVHHEREDLRFLFAADELEVASRYLHDLSPLEQRVYARLFQRRGPWLKTASLLRYFRSFDDREEDDADAQATATTTDQDGDGVVDEKSWLPTNAAVQKTLRQLVKLGFLEPLPASQSTGDAWRDALQAVEQCATASELAALHKKLVGSSGKSRKMLTSSSSSPSEALSGKAALLDSIKRVVSSQRRIDGSRIPVGAVMQQIWLDSFPLPDKTRGDHVVVRVASRSRDVLRRMLRLYYFQAAPPFASTLSMVNSPDVKQLVGLAVTRVRSEPTQWPGLLVFFSKIAYPTYELVNRRRVFESSELFVCYEVARQLRHLMSFVEQFMEVEVPETPEPDLELKWLLGDATPPLMAFQRLTAVIASVTNDDSDDGFELLEEPATTDKTSWQLRSWEEFYQVIEERVSTLDDLVLLTKSCLKAYMTWTEHMDRFAEFKTSSDSQEVTTPPVFFAKCNAGHYLARAVHSAVTLYEKQRKYQVAILLLNELLVTPLLGRKRGTWWERLALNLEHLKCSEQALQTCVNALRDPLVLDADRIALERRLARLKRKLDPPSTSNEDGGEVLDDLVIDDDKASGKPEGDYNYRASYLVGRPLNRAIGEKSRFIGFDDEPCGVEQLVLQYYRVKHVSESDSDSDSDSEQLGKRGGWYGVHCEGMVLGNLFGVLMWDVLYASVPDVFQTPFQVAPLDFGHAEAFVSARRALIDERLAAIEHKWSSRELLTFFVDTWRREFGKLSRFVRWPRATGDLSLRFLLLVVVAMGREALGELMRYMATSEDYHHAQSGLPDLLLLKVEPTSLKKNQDTKTTLDDAQCLDVYAFCGMEYRTNMNVDDSRAVGEPVTPSEPAEEWQDVLQFVDDAAKWRLQLKIVEVKGPRDRLSDKQLLWLRVLTEQLRLDASVMHVVEEQTHADKQKEKRKNRKPPVGNKRRKS